MLARGTFRLALGICSIAVLLHLYTALFSAEGGISGFLVGLVLLSCLPCAVAAALATRRRLELPALGFAAASLIADLYMHCSVFIAPNGSTAALGLLFMPVWNLLAVGPAGAVLLWLAHRLLAGRQSAP